MSNYSVYLVRSEEYDAVRFWEVVALLQTIPGPITFLTKEAPLSENELVNTESDYLPEVRTWSSFFKSCETHRKQNQIAQDAYVILLTNHDNNLHFYAAVEEKTKKNIFVNCEYNDLFNDSLVRYPVAFNCIAMLLITQLFDSYQQVENLIHQEAKGCLLDFCSHRQDLLLKMRTGDLCDECIAAIQRKKIDPRFTNQLFQYLDSFANQMKFKQRLAIRAGSLKLEIREPNKRLFFTELGDLEIKLTPLEKTVYLLFLAHPQGIVLTHLPDYRNELLSIYNQISTLDDREDITARITTLSNPLENSIHEKMSKIKNKFILALGATDAAPFIISGRRGEAQKIQYAAKVGL